MTAQIGANFPVNLAGQTIASGDCSAGMSVNKHATLTALDQILRRLEYVGGCGERYFLRAGDSLGKAVGRFDRFTAPLLKLVAISEGGKLAVLIGHSTDLETQSRELVQSLQCVFAGIDTMHRGALALASDVDEIRRIIRTMSIVALNARVNAAVLSTHDAGLDSFTLAASGLVDEAYAIVGAIDSAIQQMSARVVMAKAESSSLSRTFDSGLSQTLVEMRENIAHLDTDVAQASAAGGEIAVRIGAIQRAVCSVVMTLQIGDATHQRLENAGKVIAAAERQMRAEGALSLPLLQLASALLRDAKSRHDIAIGIGRSDLQKAHSLILDLVGSEMMGETTGVRHSNSIQRSIVNMRRILEGCRTSQTHLNLVSKQLTDGFKATNEIIGTMGDVEVRMRMISLNAVIVCARLGDEGMALRENALQLRDLVSRSRVQFGHLRECIATLSPVVASVGQRLSVDVGTQIRAIATLEASLITELDEITAMMRDAQSAATGAKAVTGNEISDGDRALGAQFDLFRTVDAQIGQLELLAAGCNAAGSNAARDTEFDDLRSIYTMETERLIHDHFARIFGLAERQDGGALRDVTADEPNSDALDAVLF